MSTRPIPGQYYIAQDGEDLLTISLRAYGISDNWQLIRDANQFEFKTDLQTDVQPGEEILIPIDPVQVELKNLQSAL